MDNKSKNDDFPCNCYTQVESTLDSKYTNEYILFKPCYILSFLL